eukprot:jgi/Hompol1/5726/HPOL_004651-RA
MALLESQSDSLATLVDEISSQVLLSALKSDPAPKPRRRLKDTVADRSDGLNVLIQKTKAISLQHDDADITLNLGGEEATWVQAISERDNDRKLWGIRRLRKYVCGDNSETHAQNLIQAGVLSRLVWLLDRSNPDNVLAAWAIGNIVGDREGFRDLVLQAGTLPVILTIWDGHCIDMSQRKEAFRIAMWVVDNMCRYKPDWQKMEPAFKILPVVLNETDPYLLKECCWAIARILHQSGRHPVIDNMITKDIINDMLTTHPILRALINLTSSKNANHIQYILDAMLLRTLDYLLTDENLPQSCRASLQVFIVQIVGNIASNRHFAAEVVDDRALIKRILAILDFSDHDALKVESCICIRNLLFHRDANITKLLVQRGVIKILLKYLPTTAPDAKVRLVAVEALVYILEAGEQIHHYDITDAPALELDDNHRHSNEQRKDGEDKRTGDQGDNHASKPNQAFYSFVSSGNLNASTPINWTVTSAQPNTTKPTRGSMSYAAEIEKLGGVGILLDALTASSGQNLDQMDQDSMDIGFDHTGDVEEEEEDDDSDDEIKGDGSGNLFLTHKGLHGGLRTTQPPQLVMNGNLLVQSVAQANGLMQQPCTQTIRQMIAAKLHAMLVKWFHREFSQKTLKLVKTYNPKAEVARKS